MIFVFLRDFLFYKNASRGDRDSFFFVLSLTGIVGLFGSILDMHSLYSILAVDFYGLRVRMCMEAWFITLVGCFGCFILMSLNQDH